MLSGVAALGGVGVVPGVGVNALPLDPAREGRYMAEVSLSLSPSLSLNFSTSLSLNLLRAGSLSLSLSFALSLSHPLSLNHSLSTSRAQMLPSHELTRALSRTVSHSTVGSYRLCQPP